MEQKWKRVILKSRFKIHEAEYGNRSIAERLFKGEAYRPYQLRYKRIKYHS
jgi:hypothetical protein